MENMTAELLRAIWERANGDPLHAVGVASLCGPLQLTPEELRSALQVLEVIGLVRYEGTATAPTTVRLTAQGAAQGKKG